MTEQEKLKLISYRITRATDTFKEVQLHIENELWATAINRLYYAVFYAVSALLLKNNILAQSHAGARQMFGLHFIKTGMIPKELGKLYSEIFDMRHIGDYDDFVDFTKEDVLYVYEPAKELLSMIEQLVLS